MNYKSCFAESLFRVKVDYLSKSMIAFGTKNVFLIFVAKIFGFYIYQFDSEIFQNIKRKIKLPIRKGNQQHNFF